MNFRNYLVIMIFILLLQPSMTESKLAERMDVVGNIKEEISFEENECQVNNENFETGDLTGWVFNNRITEDIDGIYDSNYGVNSDLPNTGYYSLYLFTHALNEGVPGPRGGDLAVSRNISVSESLSDYNLTGFVYVNRCYSVHYENWAGVVISFFDSSLAELGRIYYQFAEDGISGELGTHEHEINLYDNRGEWLRFNRNLTADYYNELSLDPSLITHLELAFYVRVADGTNAGNEGYCDAYFDNWYFDTKNYPLIFARNEDFEAFGLPGAGTETEPYLIEDYAISTDQVDLITLENTNIHCRISNCDLDGHYSDITGIKLYNASNVSIVQNDIWGCLMGLKIDYYSLGAYIFENDISYCFQGIVIQGASDNNTIVENNLFNNYNGAAITSSFYNNISKNIMYNNSLSAFYFVTCKWNNVSENTIYNHSITTAGIYTQECDNCTFHENEIYDCGFGIQLDYYSLENKITCNQISHLKQRGILLTGASDRNLVKDNNITNSRYVGIFLESAFENLIYGNTIFNTEEEGIYLLASNYNDLAFNTIIKSQSYAVYLDAYSAENDILHNNFVNCPGIIVYSDNATNSFQLNFYDGYFTVDFISSMPPFVIHPHGITDNSPQKMPYSGAFVKYLTKPTIIEPNGTATLVGSVEFDWLPSFGCPDEDVEYSLYYSLDGGSSWIEIVSGMVVTPENTHYTWDTTTIENRGGLALKVIASCSWVTPVEAICGYAITIENPEPTTTTTTTAPQVTPAWTVLIVLLALCFSPRSRRKRY